jgi:hypothetical protein
MSSDSLPISRHPDNPRYFLYRGRPRVLITATEHYGAVLNRNFDYAAYLEEAADRSKIPVRGQMTLSRCFLLFRELEGVPLNPHSPCKPRPHEYLAPFGRTGPEFAHDGYPKFNLDEWNPEYFARLHGFLAEAARRDVIVELTLFSNTYAEAVWNLNPFNVKNNVNGVGNVAWQDYNSMRDPVLFARQIAYVRKIVREVNRYDNFYLEVCNEPFGGHPGGHASVAEVEAWERTIRGAIRDEESRLPKRHLIFQVPVECNRKDLPLESVADEPDVDAINFHDYQQLTYGNHILGPLARFMQRDLRLDRINRLWTTCHRAGKPLVFDEDNSCTNGLDPEAWTIHRKRAWTVICSGGHYDMIDFSIQAAGGEAGSPAARAHIRTWLKHLSTFIHAVDFVHTTPARGFCSTTPPHTLAATLANPGREYVIYVADCREKEEPAAGEPCAGTLAFELPEGAYQARLYEPVSGEYRGGAIRLEGGAARLDLPEFVHDLVVHVQRV